MDIEQELRLALDLGEVEQQAIVGDEEVTDRPAGVAPEDLVQTSAALFQAGGGLLLQRIRIADEQVPRLCERGRLRTRSPPRGRSPRGHAAKEPFSVYVPSPATSSARSAVSFRYDFVDD